MSNAPFLLLNHRRGFNYGPDALLDSMSNDTLNDAYSHLAMGNCAEKTGKDFGITREEMDNFCMLSFERTINSNNTGIFKDEIAPIKANEKDTEMVVDDEGHKKYKKEKIPTLKPAFVKNGNVTAANSSGINDGACALVLMSEEKVKEHNLKPLARIVSYADGEAEPIDFCSAPVIAAKLALKRANLKVADIDFFEFNEAFAVVPIVAAK